MNRQAHCPSYYERNFYDHELDDINPDSIPELLTAGRREVHACEAELDRTQNPETLGDDFPFHLAFQRVRVLILEACLSVIRTHYCRFRTLAHFISRNRLPIAEYMRRHARFGRNGHPEGAIAP